MIKLSYIKSDDRLYNIDRCLSLIKSDITKGIKGAKKVVLKAECPVADNQLACTHVDALASVLEFITPYLQNQVTLIAGTNAGDSFQAFKRYQYHKLQDFYDLAIIDLNSDDYGNINLVDDYGDLWPAKVSKTLLDADYIISVCPPKTHKNLVFTGAVSNVTAGSLFRENSRNKKLFKLASEKNEQNAAFASQAAIKENFRRLTEKLRIGLGVIDGYEVMQGDGPIDGELVPGHFGIAGTKPMNCDLFACKYLGIDSSKVPYLEPAGPYDLFIIGDDWQKNMLEIKY